MRAFALAGLLCALASVGCARSTADHAGPPAAPDASSAVTAKPPATWPKGLVTNLDRVEISRARPNEAPRSATVVLRSNGTWWCEQPFRGEADPDAIERLTLALASPRIVSTFDPASAKGASEFEITLGHRGGSPTHLRTFQAALGAPVQVTIDGVGGFVVDPVELSNKLPDPNEFPPAGLWVAANFKGTSLEVHGPHPYKLVGKDGEWRTADGRKTVYELDDFPGIVTGRQAIERVKGDPATFGLARPVAEATLCALGECRTFKFGKVSAGGRTHYYAVAPDSDPVELRDNDWMQLVEGPFVPRKR